MTVVCCVCCVVCVCVADNLLQEDLYLAKYACIALQKLKPATGNGREAAGGEQAAPAADQPKRGGRRKAATSAKESAKNKNAASKKKDDKTPFERMKNSHPLFPKLAEVILERAANQR